MKILFIGGNGNISWWCVQKALEAGYEVYELNRAQTRRTRRDVQTGIREIITDIRDEDETKRILGDRCFDVVCDFICFNRTHAKQAIRVFGGKCSQYIVISSEAVYQRKSEYIPFCEDTPQYDLDVEDDYIAGKIDAEKEFIKAFREEGFPVTIVRPGYTYDTIIQVPVGQNCFTAPKRFLEGYPYLIPGDGENLVAPLHSRDFAEAFVKLLGVKETVGEAYHIAAERVITQNEMAADILEALGCERSNLIHIPYKEAIALDDFYSSVVNRQHMWHYIFDDAKIKSIAIDWKQKVLFHDGIQETVSWLLEDAVRQRINKSLDDKLMELYQRLGCKGVRA